MIAFKVVDKRTRHGSNWTMFYRQSEEKNVKGRLAKIKKKIPNIFPRYKKNRIINSLNESPGIYCFSSIYSAKAFIYTHALERYTKIIKVRGFKEKNPSNLAIYGCGFYIENLLDFKNKELKELSYSGVICFESVLVLE